MFFLGGVQFFTYRVIEHALTERLQFEPLWPPPARVRRILAGKNELLRTKSSAKVQSDYRR